MKDRLEKMGAIVDFYDERPSNNSMAKALIRINKRLVYPFIKKYYKHILERVGNLRYDYFFLIKGEATPSFFLASLRKTLPDAVFVYYTYDSIFNNRNALANIQYFDRKFTFDNNDIKEVKDLRFRPLFYLDEYADLNDLCEIKYDLSFIGTVHSDRYQFIHRLLQNIERKNIAPLNVFLFLYCQSKWYYYFRKVTDRTFRNAKRNEISFIPLSKKSIFNVFSESKCIVDIQHPNQSGLTMRTLEAVGARKKIITTNQHVKHYDIYNPANILVVDRLNPEVDAQFFHTKYVELPNEVYQKYKIENFLLDLLIR